MKKIHFTDRYLLNPRHPDELKPMNKKLKDILP